MRELGSTLRIGGILVLLMGGLLVVSREFATMLPIVGILYIGLLILLLGAIEGTRCSGRSKSELILGLVVGLTLAVSGLFVFVERNVYEVTVINGTDHTIEHLNLMVQSGEYDRIDRLGPGQEHTFRIHARVPPDSTHIVRAIGDNVTIWRYSSGCTSVLGVTEDVVLNDESTVLRTCRPWHSRLRVELAE